MEDATGLVFNEADGNAAKLVRVTRMRDEFSSLYRKPYAGKIYLPHFCVKAGDVYEPLDYFRHLMTAVEVDRFPYDKIGWEMTDALKEAKDRFYRISLGSELMREEETEADHIEGDAATQAWIVASLTFDYLSHKQLRRIVAHVCEKLIESELSLKVSRLSLVKFVVRDSHSEPGAGAGGISKP